MEGNRSMRITINANGLQVLRERLIRAQDAVMPAVVDAITETGNTIKEGLSHAAPRGLSSADEAAQPIEGDIPGRLGESFAFEVEADAVMVHGTVSTNQPQKLAFVVGGRGPIYPVNKRALYWQGLDHPVRSARASQANDFVSPVVDAAMAAIPERIEVAMAQVQLAMDEG